MSTVSFCDGCGEQLKALNELTYSSHIEHLHELKDKYIDQGYCQRSWAYKRDLCNRCYNDILGVAYAKLMEIRELNNTNKESKDRVYYSMNITPPTIIESETQFEAAKREIGLIIAPKVEKLFD